MDTRRRVTAVSTAGWVVGERESADGDDAS